MKRAVHIGLGILFLVSAVTRRACADTASNESAVVANSPIAIEPLKQDARHAIVKGLDWLKAHQKENGSWSNENFPGLTALGLWAFLKSDHPSKNEVCKKAAAFVSGFVQPDGGIYKLATGERGSGGLSTYNTAICMMALHYYDSPTYAPVIQKARTFVAGCQLQGDSPQAGGFGYDKVPRGPRDHADLSNTGWALMAMRVTEQLEDLRSKAEKRADLDWDAALRFVEKLQTRDEKDAENNGGFGYAGGGERGGTFVDREGVVKLRGYGSMTYAGLESMIYAHVKKDDPRVVSAVQWAARHWSVDENPGMGTKGLYYYYNIMAKALSLMQRDSIPGAMGEPIPWKQQLMEKLVKVQQADGSWMNTDNTFWEGDAALVTAYAVLTLQYTLAETDSASAAALPSVSAAK